MITKLLKYNSSGVQQWIQTKTGTTDIFSHSLALDKAGNSYLTGDFQGTTKFGSITLTSIVNTDMFVVKYDRQIHLNSPFAKIPILKEEENEFKIKTGVLRCQLC